ncbi:Rap1a/Tai family immunity protein [Nitrospirillum amazonense]|uniref:Rap1a/Tai family immunity protein n=1 Tax=Nitrospirillum amazonense TaxID=28077 RepID=UPI00119DE00C|nr:hypothetical protein [Nitrospirillum amazonense]
MPPSALAKADDDSEVKWFMGLLKTNNGKTFCLPASATPGGTLQALIRYNQEHRLPDAPTEPQVLAALAQMYPCAKASAPAPAAADEYATIDNSAVMATMQTLVKTTGRESDPLIDTIKNNAGNYAPVVFFPMAKILFQEGDVDGAIFWLNAGLLRGTFDGRLCTDPSAGAGIGALMAMVPPELRKAQFDDMAKLSAIIDRVIQWDETTPYNYDHRWIALHGLGAMRRHLGADATSPPQPLTIPKDQWDAVAQKDRKELREGIAKAIATVEKSRQAPPSGAPQADRPAQ